MKNAEQHFTKANGLINAQLIAKENPETFFVPSQQELNSIAIGDDVKICSYNERFWVEVANLKNDNDGNLKSISGYAGLGLPLIEILPENIYDIFHDNRKPKTDKKEHGDNCLKGFHSACDECKEGYIKWVKNEKE